MPEAAKPPPPTLPRTAHVALLNPCKTLPFWEVGDHVGALAFLRSSEADRRVVSAALIHEQDALNITLNNY